MVVLPVSYKLRYVCILAICPEQALVHMSAYLPQQAGSGVVTYQINGYFTNVCAACFDFACLTFKLFPPAHYMKFN